MNPKLLIGICTFILLIAAVNAVTTSYESASVSRITGNTPEDLINQLDTEELNLNHASYYGQDPFWQADSFEEKDDIIQSLFNYHHITNNWDYDSVHPDYFQSNELFVIEAEGRIEDNHIISEQDSTELTTNTGWRDNFADYYPFL